MEGLYVKNGCLSADIVFFNNLYEPYKWEQYSMVKYGSGQVA